MHSRHSRPSKPRHSAPPPDRAAIEAMLAPWVPDPQDRAFVARCLGDEGPPHHRASTFALLSLLQRATDLAPPAGPRPASGPTVPVPLRVPPHVRESLDPAEREYPIAMPSGALARCFPDPVARSLAVESLADGPAHHALANVLMVAMLDELLRRLGDGP
ncbi:MAG: hypothetical protein Q8S73_37215 [Deltaproteobacteria bacterium]|nr:hypothetical protein [Myxococcales bacterium]MDP3219802.1 hypothetical protein [Deltaproteobacteria bacterium]